MVYEKSALGLNEFTKQHRTLNAKERQVLILVNGGRSTDDLEKFFHKDQLGDILNKLATAGYIQPFSRQKNSIVGSATSLPYFSNISPSLPIDSAKMTAIKAILIEATDDYLGLMGRNIKSCIQSCNNQYDLRSCISIWHMAMRDSKLGRESTNFLMEQIHQTLEDKLLEASPATH